MRSQEPDERLRAWFEDLFRDHYASIYKYAVRRVGVDAVDDVVAEAFIAAWRHRGRRPPVDLSWLYGAASNHVLHVHRGRRRRALLAGRLGLLGGDREGAADASESVASADEVNRILGRLPVLDAEVLRLSAWEELSPEEIARVLRISPVATRARLHRARRRAAALLDRAPTSLTGDAARLFAKDMR